MSKFARRDFLKLMGTSGIATVGAALLPLNLGVAAVSAQAGTRLGKVVTTYTPAARIHTYVAPEQSVLVTTHIIETENQLVLVDGQFAAPFAEEAKAFAESLNKPFDRLILSHDHPDHWSGSAVFAVPFVTTANIVTNLQNGLDSGQYQAPEGFVMPTGSLQAGTETIDGLTFEISVYENAEALEQLVIRIPEAKTVILQDLMYSNTYFFPGFNRPNWIAILEELRTMMMADAIETVLVGHGVPTTRGALDTGIEFLAFLEEQFTTAATAADAVAAIQARYPSYEAAFILTFYEAFFPSN